MTHRMAVVMVALALFIGLLSTEAVHALSVLSQRAPAHRCYETYDFDQYVKEFNKKYSSPEDRATRKSFFERNLAAIKAHNADSSALFWKGVNHMTDWSTDEFQGLNGARPQMRHRVSRMVPQKSFVSGERALLPYQVDYRTANPPVLTAIKNQGHCGSCWAHSAAEAIESHWAIATGNLFVLSQQQLTSCTPNPRHCGGTGGCFGSVESLAYEYVFSTGGIAEEWTYSYTSYHGDSGVCKDDTCPKVASLSGYYTIQENDQATLMSALAVLGPIAVSVDASAWSAYAGGIFDGCHYNQNITQNHAVQLVGYGSDPETGKDYWIIRNSWGPLWGENGYMRLLREPEASCGWSVDAHSGAACDGDPDEVWVCGMCGILSGATAPAV